MDTEWLQSQLATARLGHTVEHHAATTSTNDRAAILARGGAAEGVCVTADTQTAGRGRLDRTWYDTPGHCLLTSVILRPQMSARHWPLIGLATCVAIAEAIRDMFGVPAATKWPNDVVLAGPGGLSLTGPRKLAGILLEGSGDAVILGFGVNVLSTPDTRDECRGLAPCSLADASRVEVSREALLVGVLRLLDDLYGVLEAGRTDDVLARFRRLDTTLGKTVTLMAGGETVCGTMRAIGTDGQAVISTPDGIRSFAAGDLTVPNILTPDEVGDP